MERRLYFCDRELCDLGRAAHGFDGDFFMSWLDYLVLIGTMLGIAAYGIWRTRGKKNLSSYLKGAHTLGWGTIGLSVMATQARAITFLSTTGQGYGNGLGFVQNYFGMP